MTRATSRLVVLAALFSCPGVAAFADPFDVIQSYRFIPRLSSVVESGGITGRELDYSVWGKFNLNLGPEVSIPELEIHPKFENVASWLNPDSPLTYVLHTDQVFGLTRLEGSYRRNNRITFRGTTEQGTSVKLDVTLAGPLLKITGETHPDCCDQFAYSIDALAYRGPFADFNFDGTVNSADYTTWRNHLGLTAGATLDQGDADGDGDVDHADYAVWKRDLGTEIDLSGFADAESLAFSAAPEPSSIALLLCTIVGLGSTSRRRTHGPAKLPTA
jgi:hypothetical protein